MNYSSITEQLTLSQLKEKIQEILEETQKSTRFSRSTDLYREFKAITKIKSDTWQDEDKKVRHSLLHKAFRLVLNCLMKNAG